MKNLVAVSAVVFGFALSPALAQDTAQGGLVNVSLSNVKPEIAKNINVDVSQVPVTVQVPVGIAANVCGVEANVLAKKGPGGAAECTAKNTSSALNDIVQKQAKSQKAGSKN